MSDRVTVVGIGADGWDGLTGPARDAVAAAEVLMGSTRQLDLVPDATAAERVAWPSPLLPALPGLLASYEGRRVCVLASGDPTYHGIGTTLVRLLGADRVRIVPHPSSVSLASARLGWAQDQVVVVSLVGRPVALLHPHVQPGRRVLVLGAETRVREVAGLLTDRGYGDSPLTVLAQLGSDAETTVTTQAKEYDAQPDPLVLAIECRPDDGAPLLPVVPGLPDEAFENDGQLTKREVRAVALSRLAPIPGQLLWDVGAGAGSIAIEWSRTHPSCRAVAVESHPDRVRRIERNATALGVPGLQLVEGKAPEALAGLDAPDAAFVGGGATGAGVIETCWQALRPGGRLVVSAVTLETEAVLSRWYGELGGGLVRVGVQRASAVGGMTGWRPAMPVTIWSVVKR